MPRSDGLMVWLVAHIRALLPGDWQGAPGKHFCKTTEKISDFAAKNNLRLHDLTEGALELGRRKIEGLANKEYATALKEFAETERTEMDIEYAKRSMKNKLKKEEAEADKARADADLAHLNVLEAQLALLQKLQEIGVMLCRDANGNLSVWRADGTVNLKQLSVSLKESIDRADAANPRALDQRDPPSEAASAE